MLRFTQRLPLVLGGLVSWGRSHQLMWRRGRGHLTTELSAGLRPVSSQPIRQPPRRRPSCAASSGLAVVGNVLYVAAHPDDENTRLLSYLVGERQLRTAYLSPTRGDGGQNLIGAEQGPLLGLIRTQSFGGSPRRWRRAVVHPGARLRLFQDPERDAFDLGTGRRSCRMSSLAIRRFRPDVILTRFSPGPSDTHGHHTSSSDLGAGGFLRAADPTYEPDQVATYGAWATGGSTGIARSGDGLPPTSWPGCRSWILAAMTRCWAPCSARWQRIAAACIRAKALAPRPPAARALSTSWRSPEKWPQKGTPGAGPLDGWDFSWGRVAARPDCAS